MHFGQSIKLLLTAAIVVGLIAGCGNDRKTYINFSSPSQGQNVKIGQPVNLQLDIAKDEKIEEISYYIDGVLKANVHSNEAITIESRNLAVGFKNVMAIVTIDGLKDTVTTNIVLIGNAEPKKLSYTVEKIYPHDVNAYTEGLSFVDGKLLESTGEKGKSELKYVDLQSGKTLKSTALAPQYFGEGSLKIDDKIIMLTWRENIGFVFDANSLKQLSSFPYQQSLEGWGLTFDGKHILRTDGTNRIWLMNAENFKEEGYLEVYDNKGPVNQLNELEYINGKIYANVYLTNKIVIINPNNGIVESEVDLSALVPKNLYKTQDEVDNNVLNGIAWDTRGKRLFVGGKKWPKLYQIKVN